MHDQRDLPYRTMPIDGRIVVLALDPKERGRFEHIASFYEASFAREYVQWKNEQIIGPYTIGSESGAVLTTTPPAEKHAKNANGAAGDPFAPAKLPRDFNDAIRMLTPEAHKVFNAIRDSANGNDMATVSQKQIAKITHVTGSGISGIIKRLQAYGLIMLSRPGSPTRPAIYQVASDKLLNI